MALSQVLAVLDDIETRVNNILGTIDSLLVAISYESINPLYITGKEWACCTLPNAVFQQWMATIGVGAAGLLVLWSALALLWNLDALSGAFQKGNLGHSVDVLDSMLHHGENPDAQH